MVMKSWMVFLAAAFMLPLTALAHGPSGQKVMKEVVIKAEPAKVWAVVKDFGGVHKWHPNVASTKLENRKDSDTGAELPHHLVILKDGGSILEKLRESNDADMKLDYKMVDGAESTIAVSNYRTVMQVKAGPSTGESTLTWTARFYNAANTMEAPPGKDNPAANAAINSYYDAGITGLKKMLEK
jgi:mxaD protein